MYTFQCPFRDFLGGFPSQPCQIAGVKSFQILLFFFPDASWDSDYRSISIGSYSMYYQGLVLFFIATVTFKKVVTMGEYSWRPTMKYCDKYHITRLDRFYVQVITSD